METQKGIKCGRCLDELYSNSRHDFVQCRCKAWFIDGGFSYTRLGGLPYIPLEDITREVDRAALPNHYKNPRRKKWTREMSVAWNEKHWTMVGAEVTKRLAWWETVRGTVGYGPADDEIDV